MSGFPITQTDNAVTAYTRALSEARQRFSELEPDWSRLYDIAKHLPISLLDLAEVIHGDYLRTNEVEPHIQYWEKRAGLRK